MLKDRITTVQTALLLYNSLIGVGYLALPRILVETAGRDGWVSLILGGVLLLSVNAVLVWLGNQFSGQTIIHYSQAILGRPLGQALNVIILFNFVLLAGASSRIFGDVIKSYLLENTPLEIILISFFLTGAYLAGNGLNPLARLSEVMFPLVLVPIILILTLAQMEIDYGEVLPILTIGISPIIKGAANSFIVYTGFIMTAFLVAFMQQPEKALQVSSLGLAGAILTYIVIFIITLSSLGEASLYWSIYPVADLARRIEIPGAFLEKLGTPLMAMWVLTAFTTMVSGLYFSSVSLTQMLGLKEHRGLVYLLLPIVYQVALLPRNYGETILLGNIVGYAALALIPILMLVALVAKLRQGGGGNGQ